MALPLRAYVEQNRGNPKAGMIAAYAAGDYTMQAVATAFGVHYSTVSRAIRQNALRSDHAGSRLHVADRSRSTI